MKKNSIIMVILLMCFSFKSYAGIITFADPNVKALCVQNWDTNGDGELSYTEAAAVTDIGAVFKNNTTITSFDELQYFTGLTRIGNYAFMNCNYLASVTFPNSVTSIGVYAFYNCSGLTSINIPNCVTSIEEFAFSGSSSLTSVRVNSKTPFTITSSTFSNRDDATLYVPAGSKAAYEAALYWADFNIVEWVAPSPAITFADANVKALCVANWDINGNGELNEAEAASVTDLGTVFKYNKTITSFDELQYFTGLTSIGDSAFYSCSSLASVTIPNSVTSIGNYAFNQCSGLASVTIPESVTSIGEDAFYNCSGLISVVVESGNVVYDSRDNCNAIIKTKSNTLITGCKNTFIPNSVTSIGNYAFNQCSGLASVTIPESVTSIGNYAFRGCSGLTSVTIPTRVRSIGYLAFYGCSGLTEIVVESGNTVYDSRNNCNAIIETASNELIVGCNNTIIPNSVTSIGKDAFYNCSGLTSVTIPNSVTTIGEGAFSRCSGLTSVTIPNSVTRIKDSAFFGCSGLTSIVIGNSVTSIGSRAFEDCSGLTSVTIDSNTIASKDYSSSSSSSNLSKIFGTQVTEYIFGNSVTAIGNSACYNCRSLTSVTIGNSVTSIGKSAFSGCFGLTSVTIGNSVTNIGDYAFNFCRGLASVTIPNSVTSIGYHAFEGCSGLTSVTIPNSVTSIGGGAFSNCSGLTSIIIGNSVTSIAGAFSNCSSLTSVTINSNTIASKNYSIYSDLSNIFGTQVTEYIFGNSVTAIGNCACYSCSNLTSVTIGNSVASIGEKTFYNCSGLTSVTINSNTIASKEYSYSSNLSNIFGTQVTEYIFGDSVTAIGDYACDSCSNLTTVIGNSVTSIGEYAFFGTGWYDNQSDGILYLGKCLLGFKGNKPEGDFIINSGTKGIASYAFSNCSGLTSITIPNSVTSIGSNAFAGCSGLTSVTIPNSVTSIEAYAFYNCSGLTSVIIPGSVTSIGNYAFEECTGLTSVTIPESVTSIGERAFSGCSGLTSVKVDIATPLTISSSTFSNRAKATLYIPKGSNYKSANYWKEFKVIIEFLEGDVNGDGETDMVDVVDIARYVVGTPAEAFVQIFADINIDGVVNIGDAVVLVNDIAGDQNFAKALRAPRKATTSEEELTLTLTSEGFALNLTNQRDYTAFQFDLHVPEGTDVARMLLNPQRKKKHQLLYNKVVDGHYRVAAISTSNNTFQGNNGELLSFALDSDCNGEIVISDIRFFDTSGGEYLFNALPYSGAATGIQSLTPAPLPNGEGSVYTLDGTRVSKTSSLPKGIYIVNGKKVVVK